MTDTPQQKKQLNTIRDLIKSKFYTLARTALDEALEESPTDVRLKMMLLELYQQTNDHWESKRLIEELLLEQPENDNLFKVYPKALLGCGQPAEAVERAQELQERLGDDSFMAQGILADMYETTSRTEELREVFQRMTPTTPMEHVAIKVCHAKLLGREKDYARSASMLEEAYDSMDALRSSSGRRRGRLSISTRESGYARR